MWPVDTFCRCFIHILLMKYFNERPYQWMQFHTERGMIKWAWNFRHQLRTNTWSSTWEPVGWTCYCSDEWQIRLWVLGFFLQVLSAFIGVIGNLLVHICIKGVATSAGTRHLLALWLNLYPAPPCIWVRCWYDGGVYWKKNDMAYEM